MGVHNNESKVITSDRNLPSPMLVINYHTFLFPIYLLSFTSQIPKIQSRKIASLVSCALLNVIAQVSMVLKYHECKQVGRAIQYK